MSVNPIDTTVRAGTYGDAPDYYSHVPRPFQVVGYDGAGVVLAAGPDCSRIKPGDEVFYLSSPTKQGTTSEYQILDERTVAIKPKSLDFVEAAGMSLTYGTAMEMMQLLDVTRSDKVGVLIINGAGGVGNMAIQIAKQVFELPAVIATAGRDETKEWCKRHMC